MDPLTLWADFLLQLEGSTLAFKLLSDLDKDKDGATLFS